MLHVIEEAEIGGAPQQPSVTLERRIQEAFWCVFVCKYLGPTRLWLSGSHAVRIRLHACQRVFPKVERVELIPIFVWFKCVRSSGR